MQTGIGLSYARFWQYRLSGRLIVSTSSVVAALRAKRCLSFMPADSRCANWPCVLLLPTRTEQCRIDYPPIIRTTDRPTNLRFIVPRSTTTSSLLAVLLRGSRYANPASSIVRKQTSLSPFADRAPRVPSVVLDAPSDGLVWGSGGLLAWWKNSAHTTWRAATAGRSTRRC